MTNALLGAKVEFDLPVGNANVAIPERCEAETLVLPCYSGLPTRAKVRSIDRTTAVKTFSRGKPGLARSASTWRRISRQDAAKS